MGDKGSTKAFTIVELIIVLAIIGIVAALWIGYSFGGKDKQLFMKECAEHEPHYQCEYKWKQIHPGIQWVYHVG